MQTAIPVELPLVEFDAVLIGRVLVNLLENAAKYGAPPIVVSARAEPTTLVLSVRDHGRSLPAAPKGQEGRLFDKSSPAAKPSRPRRVSAEGRPSARRW